MPLGKVPVELERGAGRVLEYALHFLNSVYVSISVNNPCLCTLQHLQRSIPVNFGRD